MCSGPCWAGRESLPLLLPPSSSARQLILQQEIGGRLTKGLLLSGLCGPVKRSCNSHPAWLFLPWTSPVTCFPFQIRLTPSKIRNLLETWSLLERVVSASPGDFCTVLGVGRVQSWKGSWSLDWEGDKDNWQRAAFQPGMGSFVICQVPIRSCSPWEKIC